MYRYETPSWISAATTGKGEELDEARAFGVGAPLVLPRQTHSDHVVRVSSSCRPEDTDAVFIKELCELDCSLTAECNNNADRLLNLNDVHNIFGSKRLEVESVRCVIVGGNGFGVVVDDCNLVTKLFKSPYAMN